MSSRKLSICFALLLVVSAAAAEGVRVKHGCRRGVLRQHSVTRRALASAAPDKYQGDRRQLVVLAEFSDFAFKESEPLALWSRIFNEENFSEAPFHGSVYDYFYAQSYGEFRLSFDLRHVVVGERAKYRSTSDDDENSKYLVLDVLDSLESRHIDWAPYDWNGDGYVDQLLIVYAGKGQHDGGDSNTIWAHQWWLSYHEDCAPRTVVSGDRELLVDTYCCVPELGGGNNYGAFGTLCHEYSHCFGFPDFYDDNGKSCVGSWDLMDYGNYSGGGFCPCGYSAHERMLMGWGHVTELTSPTTVSNMQPLSEAGEAYLIRNDGWEDEYYIVENRQQSGWDQSLPGSGIVVFHIDYDAEVWAFDWVNTSDKRRYTIFAANNSSSAYQSGWAYPYEDNDQLTNESQPAAALNNTNPDGTLLMSKPITNMTVTGGLASFDFMAGSSAVTECTVRQPGQLLYRVGPINIIRCSDGSVRKVMSK